jgi:transcriptional regulator with XRE-family HTH domain
MEMGQRLFEARQRRGLTLDKISRTTKIPVSLLQAIERNDTTRLPQGFFTRAFVRAYANEVGVDAGDLLDNSGLGGVEEIAMDASRENVPIHEPSSPKSLLLGLALGAACTMVYAGLPSQAPAPVSPPVAIASVTDRAEPVALAPPPCAPATPPDTPVQSVRRPAGAVRSEKIASPVQPIPVTHAVAGNEVETSAAAVDSSPGVSDAILPTPDPALSPAVVEQF